MDRYYLSFNTMISKDVKNYLRFVIFAVDIVLSEGKCYV